MTLDELCELLLEDMVGRFREKNETMFKLEEIAREHGVTDRGLVYMALEALQGEGFVEDMRIANSPCARLKATGLARSESGGAVVLDRGIAVVDRSTNIHGDVIDSNVAVNSRDVVQYRSSHETMGLLDRIEEILRQDTAIPTAVREDCLADMKTLRREIDRETSRTGILRELLSNLGSVSSIAGLVIQVGTMLGVALGG